MITDYLSHNNMNRTIVRPCAHKQATHAKSCPTISYVNIPNIQPPKPYRINTKHNPRNVQRSIYATTHKQPVQPKPIEQKIDAPSVKLPTFQNVIGMNCIYCHSDKLHVSYDDVIEGRPLTMFVVCLECGSRYKKERGEP